MHGSYVLVVVAADLVHGRMDHNHPTPALQARITVATDTTITLLTRVQLIKPTSSSTIIMTSQVPLNPIFFYIALSSLDLENEDSWIIGSGVAKHVTRNRDMIMNLDQQSFGSANVRMVRFYPWRGQALLASLHPVK